MPPEHQVEIKSMLAKDGCFSVEVLGIEDPEVLMGLDGVNNH